MTETNETKTNEDKLALRLPGGRVLGLDRPRVMGILNVTPDSFSDGGRFDGLDGMDRAIAHAEQMLDEGADLIDVGGESTRPGAKRISAEEQIERVVPVIEALVKARPEVLISVDTTQATVGRAALEAGAVMLNDVAAGTEDPEMLTLAAEYGCPIVLMHMQGKPATMQDSPVYGDVVEEVLTFLMERAQAAEAAGVKRSQVVIDPGIGFGKTLEHNLTLLAHLKKLVDSSHAVLLGASRKRFIQQLDEKAAEAMDRVGGTCATTAAGVAAGVQLFRVHDVAANVQAVRVAEAIHQASC